MSINQVDTQKTNKIRYDLLSRKVKDVHPKCSPRDGEAAAYKGIYVAAVTMNNGDVFPFITAEDTYSGKSMFFNPETGVREYPLWATARPASATDTYTGSPAFFPPASEVRENPLQATARPVK